MKILKNERVLYYFEEISKIPRCSGHEQKIHDYLMKKGEEFGAEVVTDDALNLVIRKKASPGKEDYDYITLQGHMDMVCIKEGDSSHDFEKDPIPLLRKGQYLTADKTTLGADNGIAIAMMLAILEDDSLNHPPLEMVITSEEEVGLVGAHAFKEGVLKSKKFINLDSETEGVLTIGCAGGVTVTSNLSFPVDHRKGHVYELEISGYPGGHSGMDINKNIPNPLKVLVELLKNLRSEQHIFYVSSLEGGDKHNSIPTWARVVIVSEEELNLKKSDFQIFQTYELIGLKVDFSFKELDTKVKSLDYFASFDILDIIDILPNGPLFFFSDDKKEVLSSSNIGKVRMVDHEDKKELEVITSIRSSWNDHLKELPKIIENLTLNKKGKIEVSSFYPPWEPAEKSTLKDLCLKIYKEEIGEDMKVEVLHAGLETAIFKEKYPEIDYVSIGPNMKYVHTAEEVVSLDSVDRVYDYVLKVLERL